MRTVLADTAFYAALLNPDDADHAAAMSWGRESALRVLVTEFILVELGNYLSTGRGREHLAGLVLHLRNDAHTTVVPVSTALFDAGLDLYSHRPDKEWSLTDCISFVVMKDRGLTEALTTDHHFEQAGFKALMK